MKLPENPSIEQKWDSIYSQLEDANPAKVLTDNNFLLPTVGCALDLASGLGGNALLLAEHGLETHAWDISSIALSKLGLKAEQKDLKISLKHGLIESGSLPKDTFDVIVLTRFLDRSLCNEIMESLKANGLLFYQTYVQDKIDAAGPKNPEYLLAPNELLMLFSPLKLVFYRENSTIGRLQEGERNEAMFVGQKC